MEPCPICHSSANHDPGCPEDSGLPREATAVLTSVAPLPAMPPPAASMLTPRPGDLPDGTQVGEYRVTTLLGRGGMGTVYAGVHPVIGKRVAIKVLLSALAVDRGNLERFQREAQAVNRIGHPAVVDVFAFGQLPQGAPYLVMELLEGQNLGARVRQGAFPLAEVRDLFCQILDGLQAAHEVGVVHRDLKPDNIMLVKRGDRVQVKILDFGIAKLVGHDETSLTRSGVALGTPAYMSPEQALGRPVGPQTDIYATSVILYLCVTGRPPFLSDSSFEVQRKHVTEPPEPPSLYADMPPELEAVILRGLQKNPGARFPSAQAMAEALRQVPQGELRRRPPPAQEGDAVSLPSQSSSSSERSPSSNTLLDVSRRHRRKQRVVFLPVDASACPEPLRALASSIEDGLHTRLCELAEVDVCRPLESTTGTNGTGRQRGESTARTSGADIYVEITLQGTALSAPVRGNLRIGTANPEETPYSARVISAKGDPFELEDLLAQHIEAELKQRARSHILRVRLVDESATQPAQRSLLQAEQLFSSPWDRASVIESVLKATDHALSLDPDYPEAYYRRGTARMWLAATGGGAIGDEQIDLAIADLSEAKRRLPHFGPGALFLSLALGIRGRLSEALQAVDVAAGMELTRPGQRASDALVCDVTLAWHRVLATILPSDRLFADQGLPHLILARVLTAMGRLDEAEAVLTRLLPIEEADAQATRTGQRRTMRTLPLYGPALVKGAILLAKEDPLQARDVLLAERERLSSCEHVSAPIHQLLCLRLLLAAMERIGQFDKLNEVKTAEAVLTRRLLGDEVERAQVRAFRLMAFFWVPGGHVAPLAPVGAPGWRHYLTALFATRNGDRKLAKEAADRLRIGAADEVEKADAHLLQQHLDAIPI